MSELPVVGDEFAGYLLQSVIGRGSMSVVYQAEHPQLGTGIALKVLAAELGADDVFRTRFLAESGIAASMNHPHVIPIYDVGESDGLLYIAMRRIVGTDLRQMIAGRGPLPPQTAVSLLSQAAQALDAAHRLGLVHRDVKPENLLTELIERGAAADSEHLYLADFGISRLGMERNGLTLTGQFLGTVDYVAPEQISGPSVYGSADQYSLGCMLYECLTGRVPFGKDPGEEAVRALDPEHYKRPAPLRTDLPPAVDEVFARVLAERPGDRYNTCREFMQAASVALGDLATAPLASVGSRALQPESEPVDYPASAPPKPTTPATPATPAPSINQPEIAPKRAAYQRKSAAYQREPARDAPEPAESAESHGSRSGRFRTRWLVIAAVLLLVCAGGGVAYAALSSKPKPADSEPSAMASMAQKSPMPPMPPRARTSTLKQVLTAANTSKIAMGMLPPSSCAQHGATRVVCTAPWPTIASATFTTYPTLATLFAAYEAKVRSLNSGKFRQNVQDCGLSAPTPYDEIAWNHREQHSRAYTVGQMTAGKVPVETAMGRMACLVTAGHTEDIVWTTDYGKMLGVAIGSGSHKGTWYWWVDVHHNIVFPGTPMDMGKAAPLMSGAPMPTSSASASAAPSMSMSSMSPN
jgi:serine/threonine protein kinase